MSSIVNFPTDHVVVTQFRNDTDNEVRLVLEPLCEEVLLSPGHEVELLALPEGVQPLHVDFVSSGLQVFPAQTWEPDWLLRFNGRLIRPGWPTVLKDFE